jgi:hypothetical protein
VHSIDHHVVASVSIAGTCLDVLGSLYLAYDLLGGEHGPLRLVTRAVTYSIVFGIGYGLGLGLFFGVAAGVTSGVTVAIELNRAARRGDHYPLMWEGFFSAIRGLGFAAGLYHLVGLRFTQRQFTGTVLRTIGYSAAVLCGIFAEHLELPWRFALRVGLVTGIVTGVGIAVNPYIEYYAERLPQRVLGAAGIALIFCGFMLQSFQYWVSLLDVRVI